jgi:hypothetical protein
MSKCGNMLMTGLLFNIIHFFHCDCNHLHEPAHARNLYTTADDPNT